MKNICYLLIVLNIILACENDGNRIVTRYSNGDLKEIYYINSNGIKEGKDFKFDKNGILRIIRNYKYDKIVDTAFLFSNKGDFLFHVIYGSKQDTLKINEFYPNGKLHDEYSLIEGDNLQDGPNSYIEYSPKGKIKRDLSHFVFIRYLNKQGTRLGLTLNEYKSWINQSYTKDYVDVYILRDLNFGPNWEKRCKRKIRFSKWDNITLNLNLDDYINGKVNIEIQAFQKNKMNPIEYILSGYTVQLIKGDKSRWHNVHGIEK